MKYSTNDCKVAKGTPKLFDKERIRLCPQVCVSIVYGGSTGNNYQQKLFRE